jgi:hypothetical protein
MVPTRSVKGVSRGPFFVTIFSWPS